MATDDADEIEIDYDWHPTDQEYVSPLTVDEWAELFSDEDFQASDEYRAIVCLRDYGEPATFQQLSIRYRAAMGRYRRWLAEAARIAGARFGVAEAPSHDQFGMDEWWPLLYQTRATGKPGAGIFEMQLRPEVDAAFEQLKEAERLAKRAENARQLQRIEQLERARQEERRRAAERARAAEPAPAPEPAPVPAPEPAPVPATPEPAPHMASTAPAPGERPAPEEPAGAKQAQQGAGEAPVAAGGLDALVSFLTLMEAAPAPADEPSELALDVAGPIDYALRYAERLRHVLLLMRQVRLAITAATLARGVDDESVAALQSYLNGQEIPPFAYLDKLRDTYLISPAYLEAPDELAGSVPCFLSLAEALGAEGAAERVGTGELEEVCYVVDDAPERRTGVVVRLSKTCCGLITRHAVSGAAHRSESEELASFIAMVDELDAFARANGVKRTSRQVSAEAWEALAAGTVWPGSVLS